MPTTGMDLDMLTMVTTRGLLMLRLLTVMPPTLMPTMDMLPTLMPTTDLDMPATVTTRGLLMLRLLTVMPPTLMPTTDMLPTLMPMDTDMDTITNLLNTVKN